MDVNINQFECLPCRHEGRQAVSLAVRSGMSERGPVRPEVWSSTPSTSPRVVGAARPPADGGQCVRGRGGYQKVGTGARSGPRLSTASSHRSRWRAKIQPCRPAVGAGASISPLVGHEPSGLRQRAGDAPVGVARRRIRGQQARIGAVAASRQSCGQGEVPVHRRRYAGSVKHRCGDARKPGITPRNTFHPSAVILSLPRGKRSEAQPPHPRSEAQPGWPGRRSNRPSLTGDQEPGSLFSVRSTG